MPVWAWLLISFLGGCFFFRFFMGRRDRENSMLFRETLYQSNHGMALLHPDGRIMFWNPALAYLTGRPATEALGHLIASIAPFSSDHPVIKMFSGIHHQPFSRPLTFRTQIQRSEKTPQFPVIVTLTRFSVDRSGYEMILLTVADISEAEELRDKLQKALSEAELNVKKMTEVDRLKSEFLAICGHELKTPLVSITGYLDLLASEKMGPTTQKQQNALAISLRNASRLNEILSQLLDFARMEAGKMRFEFTPQRLQNLLEEIIGTVHPMASSKGLSISLQTPPDLSYAYLDLSLLTRVILNLLDNAIKFTPKDGAITVKAWEDPERVYIEVADSGIGIPPDKVDRVKEPFFQADGSDTRKTGGLGLGLAIVEKILVGHGTQLEIDSRPGEGTRMKFSLKKAVRSASGKFTAAVLSSQNAT